MFTDRQSRNTFEKMEAKFTNYRFIKEEIKKH